MQQLKFQIKGSKRSFNNQNYYKKVNKCNNENADENISDDCPHRYNNQNPQQNQLIQQLIYSNFEKSC